MMTTRNARPDAAQADAPLPDPPPAKPVAPTVTDDPQTEGDEGGAGDPVPPDGSDRE